MKKKLVITSALTALLMAAGIVGGTIAYFSTSSETDVNITSAKINVSSVVSDLKTYSLEHEQAAGTFENGGTASLSGNVLTLDRMSPGDKATFKIAVTCDNNIKIKYRVAFDKTGALAPALEANVSGGAAEWTLINPSETPTVINLDASVAMPLSTGIEYNDKQGTVRILVEAVQGNMPQAVSTLAQFEDAIETAENGEVSLYLENDIQVTHTIEIPDNAQVNIYGDGETTITTPSNVKRPLILDAIENTTLTISGVNIQGNAAIAESNGIGFWDTENCTVNLYDVNLQQPDYYALNVGSGNEDLVINIEDSVIKGWCAFNVWSAGTTINVKNSTLRGVNPHSGLSNAFGVIVVNQTATNANINLENCVVESINEGDQYESFYLIRATTTINSTNTIYKYTRQGTSQPEIYNSIEEIADYNSWLATYSSSLSFSLETVSYQDGGTAVTYPFITHSGVSYTIYDVDEITDMSPYLYGSLASVRQTKLGANTFATTSTMINGKQFIMSCNLITE